MPRQSKPDHEKRLAALAQEMGIAAELIKGDTVTRRGLERIMERTGSPADPKPNSDRSLAPAFPIGSWGGFVDPVDGWLHSVIDRLLRVRVADDGSLETVAEDDPADDSVLARIRRHRHREAIARMLASLQIRADWRRNRRGTRALEEELREIHSRLIRLVDRGDVQNLRINEHIDKAADEVFMALYELPVWRRWMGIPEVDPATNDRSGILFRNHPTSVVAYWILAAMILHLAKWRRETGDKDAIRSRRAELVRDWLKGQIVALDPFKERVTAASLKVSDWAKTDECAEWTSAMEALGIKPLPPSPRASGSRSRRV